MPALRSLSPQYLPDEHGEAHVLNLSGRAATQRPRPARNIALTGHFGSGKSSVLDRRQRSDGCELEVKVINLSLPSLGIGDARLSEDPGDKTTLDTTNLIQKEIVKQLLYRRKPSDTPASRYNRLDALNSAQGE